MAGDRVPRPDRPRLVDVAQKHAAEDRAVCVGVTRHHEHANRGLVPLEAPVRLAALRFKLRALIARDSQSGAIVDGRHSAGELALAAEIQLLRGFVGRIEPPGGDQLVVNVGDMLERLTNGVLKSTIHRVVNPPRELMNTPRYSIPFFMHPRSEMSLAALPGCVSPSNPKKWEDITAGEFLDQRLSEIGLKK